MSEKWESKKGPSRNFATFATFATVSSSHIMRIDFTHFLRRAERLKFMRWGFATFSKASSLEAVGSVRTRSNSVSSSLHSHDSTKARAVGVVQVRAHISRLDAILRIVRNSDKA